MVDNNSSDGSVDFVRDSFPEVSVLQLDKNYGFTGGNNRGVQIAHGELLVFLNNDTIVDPNWLIELVSVVNANSGIGVCGSKIVFESSRDTVQFAGGFLNIIGSGVSPFLLTKNTFSTAPKLTGYACGACLLIRKDVFESVGGFDEDYFMYSDENDLCLRCWLLGYEVVYVPKSVVYHKGGGSVKSNSPSFFSERHKRSPALQGRILSDARLYYSNRNSYSNIWKNFEPKNIVIGSVFSGILCVYQSVSLLSKRKPEKLVIMSRGIFSFMKDFPRVWLKRQCVQGYRTQKDAVLFGKGILLSPSSLISLVLGRKEV